MIAAHIQGPHGCPPTWTLSDAVGDWAFIGTITEIAQLALYGAQSTVVSYTVRCVQFGRYGAESDETISGSRTWATAKRRLRQGYELWRQRHTSVPGAASAPTELDNRKHLFSPCENNEL